MRLRGTPDEERVIGLALETACAALDCVLAEGLAKAMSRFN